MAELAGLTVGVLGLAGTFSACIEAFGLFHASESYGRDFEILLTRLDIEKTLLLQWAEQVGLVGGSDGLIRHDIRLDQQHTHSAVESALRCILLLLTDSEKLCSDYGVTSSNDSPDPFQGVDVISSSRMRSFVVSYRQVQDKIGLRQQRASLLSRSKWAIRDRTKFSSFISHLHAFVESLNNLVPVPHHQRQMLLNEDIQRLAQDVHHLRLIQEASSNDLREWSDRASEATDMYELDSEQKQRIDCWRQHIAEDMQSAPKDIESEQATEPLIVCGPGIFRAAATGPSHELVRLCHSGLVSVTAKDTSGHSLLTVSTRVFHFVLTKQKSYILQYALDEACISNAYLLVELGADVNSMEPALWNRADPQTAELE